MIKTSLLDFVTKCTKEYGTYTLENRALADFRDGLKPVQRRVLWAMHKLGLHHNKGVKKSARVVGEVIGKYHPHGDVGTYSALANMTKSACPTVFGKSSNFGDYEDPPAAARYTECKLTEYSDKYLLDPDYLAVMSMVQNYDGEYLEPVILPAKLPNLLLNGSEGIATGCSSLIPSFSMESIVKIIKLALKGKNITPKLCAETLEFNFPYGGRDFNEDEDLQSFFKEGIGTLYFIPEYDTKNDVVTIMGIAPRFKVDKMLENLSELKYIKSVEDQREKEEIKFVIYLKPKLKKEIKESVIEEIEEIISTSLHCQTILTIRHKDGEHATFKKTAIPELINKWVIWRIDLEKKVVKYLIDREEEKVQKQEWLLFAVAHKKDIIKSLENKDPTKHLIKSLKIEKEHAEFILNLIVRRLANIEKDPISKKIKEYKLTIKTLKEDIKDVNKRIINQLI